MAFAILAGLSGLIAFLTLDHVFHSSDFKLLRLERLPPFGSDHFPILISLLLTADDKTNCAGLDADAGDEAWAREKVRSEGVDKDGVPTPGE